MFNSVFLSIMLRKYRLLLMMLFFIVESSAQSVYIFRYNFNTASDTKTYHAFLLRNDDGSGLLRIRCQSEQESEEDILAESYIDEQHPTGISGDPDTSVLLIRAISPSLIQGNTRIRLTYPVFQFNYNGNTGFYDPVAVFVADSLFEKTSVASISWKQLVGTALDKKTVGQFFSEDEDFYTGLFRENTRGLSPAEKKVRMHLLIVADTLDKRIGPSAVLDIKKVTGAFQSICHYLGINLLTQTVYGKTFGKTGVQQAIAKLQPAPADIVIFYYSGHGFRIPERPRKYPNLKLKNFIVPRPDVFKSERDSLAWVKKEREANIANTLNIEDIFNSIRKKGARLNLIISDCCNDDIFSVNTEGSRPAKTKSSGIQWNEENIRSLFFSKTRMSVLATAAQEGQKATSKNDFGGFFTDYFKNSMELHCSRVKSKVSWDMVLKQAKDQTTLKARTSYCATPKIPENACRQVPVSEVK